ncbi:MAG: hypothetical protein ACRYG5_09850 [Janthinobacterium lividum]
MNDASAYRDDCLTRFKAAVAAARNGKLAPGSRLIESVRDRFGEPAAQIAKRELSNYVKSDKGV